ncbi:MAG: glycosyltransferase [Flavobacteriales bacterium]|nr:glycosyltransferase [Flavobacteriia bacterium]NCP05712.1 glycosyltransferase [Flavobacteriales bacterium]PIV92891.1 MAG: glycosyltransferase [Flavobacteriaceae bacterium CG17_big_fil_post_rev_8_21_14_2_50_33_15]PIY12074.1 MAG: glycosyltransferase [Flavobacteriaceae bacterium CG_4_10_14_3_um_filter_33_47]PJB19239.1 MAG: glycosyltransferase [Flavobacteriaceae bacterium CG_4_9_14_3_um_filter_33_16]
MGLFTTKDSESINNLATNFYVPTSKNALIIFTRNPELGKCKTRLAKTIGNQAALGIYMHLLSHTAQISKKSTADKFVFYSENIIENDLWNSEVFRKKMQQGSDLGERMEHAFTELFALGYEKVVIIGSDLLDLKTTHIDNAFKLLQEHDLVIGPAKDGGYYLFGMKKLQPNIFKNKAWGTSTVLKDTLNDIQNCTFVLLEALNDIDTFEDIQSYQQLKKFYITND